MLKNAWYVAAWADELADGPIERMITGEAVVLWRQSAFVVRPSHDRRLAGLFVWHGWLPAAAPSLPVHICVRVCGFPCPQPLAWREPCPWPP